jgi:hypothetical protein
MSVQSPAGLSSASAVWLCPGHDGVAPSSSPIIRISIWIGKMGHTGEVYILLVVREMRGNRRFWGLDKKNLVPGCG